MKYFIKLRLLVFSPLLFSTFVWCVVSPAEASLIQPEVTDIKLACINKFSGGEKGECKISILAAEKRTDPIKLKVVSSNSTLVSPEFGEVTFPPGQNDARILLKSVGTPIKTSVTITAIWSPSIQAQDSIEVVPALLGSASLSTTSIIGTLDAKTSCRVRLRAPAPTGGIQIYLSSLGSTPSLLGEDQTKTLRLNIQNPIVPAGKDTVTFDIVYSALLAGNSPVYDSYSANGFNSVRRTLDLVVALDPQAGSKWTVKPGNALKITFDVVPILVSSFSVQPSIIKGGGEGLATLVLSAPPGNYERIRLYPLRSDESAFWLATLGSSCAQTGAATDQFEFPLVAGTTNYNFKVCSKPVTAYVSGKAYVKLRSGLSETGVTVQP